MALHRQNGWRRTGLINVILGTTCGTLLLICLVVSLKQPGSSLDTATIIFEGKCDDTYNLNIVLHLLLNLLSTAILASSNFFMQVLSSPSRKEIGKAHMFFQSLDIGIPSMRNIQFISSFKRICWLVLFLSSLPIHLFFNSSVFETTFQGSDWGLYIGTEAFTQGATYFPPGASLSVAGNSYPAYFRDPGLSYHPTGRYGNPVPLDQYASATSMIRQNITKTATNAGSLVCLDPSDCRTEYTSCKPRSKYRDVVVVVETGTSDTQGWRSQELFNLNPDLSTLWSSYVPLNDVNSLWYSTYCRIIRANERQEICSSNCADALGYSSTEPRDEIEPSNWVLAFEDNSWGSILSNRATSFGYSEKFDNLTVEYCLAELQPNTCKIGVSNLLLMVVIVCIFVKVIQCSLVLWKFRHFPLVTLGDAIESFIIEPDSQTTGLGTLDSLDSHKLETGPRKDWFSEEMPLLALNIRPRRWLPSNRRVLSVVPRNVWSRTYSLLLFSMVVLSVGLAMSYQSNDYSL